MPKGKHAARDLADKIGNNLTALLSEDDATARWFKMHLSGLLLEVFADRFGECFEEAVAMLPPCDDPQIRGLIEQCRHLPAQCRELIDAVGKAVQPTHHP